MSSWRNTYSQISYETWKPSRPANLYDPEWAPAKLACEIDNPALFEETFLKNHPLKLGLLYRQACSTAVWNNATAVLSHLIARGANLKDILPTEVADTRVTRETAEFLIAQGWDINRREEIGSNAQPLMWHVAHDFVKVKWCLEHGASVFPQGQEPLRKDVITQCQRSCPQILERVASSGNIAIFELLRSRGAPLGWRPLHIAVEYATYGTPGTTQGDLIYAQNMAMVRHLIDVVGLDVNAPDQPEGQQLPNHNGTPICYIPGSMMWLERDTRELTWFLLDRGADPAPALDLAKLCDYPKFVKDVRAWEEHQVKDQKCCVQ